MRKIKILICFFTLCALLPFSILNAEWELIDSVSISRLLPAGEKCYIAITDSFNYMELALPTGKLTDKAEAAVMIAPSWLKMDLRDNFLKLDKNFQNIYAKNKTLFSSYIHVRLMYLFFHYFPYKMPT